MTVDGLPKEKKGPPKKVLLVVLAIIVIAAVVIVAASLQGQSKYELTIVRVTIVMTYNGQTTTQVVVQDKVAGTYPVGSDLLITYPFYNSVGSGQMTLAKVESQTSGFVFVSSNPSLPIVAPNSGSTVVELRFTTPTTAYKGPFDYTIYYETTP